MSKRGYSCFLTRKFQSCQKSIIWNLAFTFPLRILLKSWTLSFKKDTITSKIVSQSKCLEEGKKLRFTFQMKDLVLHSLVRIWDTFSEVLLEMILEQCWEEKDLTNQTLLTTLSAYTLSRYTRNWLSTISLTTRRLHCCVVFLFFEAQGWRHHNYWTVIELSDIKQPTIQTIARNLIS